MEIKQSEFKTSAVKPEQYPDDNRIEVAFVGRSNVGKSSLINTLTNRRKLVKVSGTPGKTRLINFFLINNGFYFVDLPGYGYAKVSKSEKATWGSMMEKYLVNRPQLKKVVLLVDSRHKPTGDDILMYNWIRHYGYEVVVVATKKDKLTKNELQKSVKVIKETLKLSKDQSILFFSSLKKEGKEDLLNELFKDIEIVDENSLKDIEKEL
jgi:GTP-binding protein